MKRLRAEIFALIDDWEANVYPDENRIGFRTKAQFLKELFDETLRRLADDLDPKWSNARVDQVRVELEKALSE